MKKFKTLLILLLLTVTTVAQKPLGVQYEVKTVTDTLTISLPTGSYVTVLDSTATYRLDTLFNAPFTMDSVITSMKYTKMTSAISGGSVSINPPQVLSGTSPTLNYSNGEDAKITLNGETTFTLINVPDGGRGLITATENAIGGYGVSFSVAGKTVHYIPEVLPIAANINSDPNDINIFSYWLAGDTLHVNFSTHETDPIYSASVASSITAADTTRWGSGGSSDSVFTSIPLFDNVSSLVTAGTGKNARIYPYDIKLVSAGAYFVTAGTGDTTYVDINNNGVSALNPRVTVDDSKQSSNISTTQPTILNSLVYANRPITFDIDSIATTSAGTGLHAWYRYINFHTVTPQFPIPSANIVSMWEMNDPTGTNITDVQGINAGTATGTTVVSGLLNSARSFNGTSDYIQFASVPSVFNSGMTSDFSVSEWVTFNTLTARQTIFGASYNATNYIHIYTDFANYIVAKVVHGGTAVLYKTDAAVSTATQYHVVATYNGTTNALILYVNNVAYTTVAGDSQTMAAGVCVIGQTGSSTYWLNGTVDQTFITNTVMSASDVSNVYYSQKGIEH